MMAAPLSRLLALAAVSTLTVGCTIPTADIDASVDVGLMFVSPNGKLSLDSVSGGSSLGTIRNELEDSMDIGDSEVAPFARVMAGYEAHRIHVSAFGFSQDGGGILSNDFGDITAGTSINSDLTFWDLKAFYTYDLLGIGPLRIAPGAGINIISTDLDVRTPSGSAFETIETLSPVPMVFLQTELDLEVVSAVAEVGAMNIDLDDADGTWWDIEAYVRVHPWTGFHLLAGYRFIDQDTQGTADGAPFDADLDVQGWIVGGGIVF